MARRFFMQMELGWRQVGPVLPRDWQWHPSTSPFVCLFSLYPSFLSYHSGFFPPCPVLFKLLRLALKTFHVLVSICPSFVFLYCLCMFLTLWPNRTPYQIYSSFFFSKYLPMLFLIPKMPFSHLQSSEYNSHLG